MPSKEIEHITHLLGNYLTEIEHKGKFNWLSDHVHSEYFFKRLLNLLYGWKLSHSEELFGHNTSDIDLVSKKSGTVVQISANKQFKRKIDKTVEGYKTNWQKDYPKLIILFIQPSFDNRKYESNDYELISFKKIITTIENLIPTEQRRILEFLRQELSEFYDSNFYSLTIIKKFEDVFSSTNLGTGLINDFYSKNDLIYLSNDDTVRIKNFKKALENDKTNFALSGPPCSGKTTFLFEISKVAKITLHKMFYINLELDGNQENDILSEVRRIACQDAILVIDNSHDQTSLSRKLFNLSTDLDIRTLFIYRRTTNDDLTNRLVESDFDLVQNTDDNLLNLNIKNKFIGIINKRISYLKSTKSNSKWLIGDINTVIKNNESNLLKLSITLYYWETKSTYNTYRLDQINTEHVYQSFYEEHLSTIESEELINDLFLYGFLYQYGIPFYLRTQYDNDITKKGYIKKVPLTETFIFPHTDYAKLLKESILYRKRYDHEYITGALYKYLIVNKPSNLPLLLRELSRGAPQIAIIPIIN